MKPPASAPRLDPRDTPSVLVVEDDDSIRRFLQSALEAEGYRALTAGDGVEALTLCERHRPDLILLDLMLPRLDGLGFLHEYRRHFPGQSAPVYIMSAVRTAAEHAKAAGVTGVFVKPFDLDDLLETIARTLQRRSSGLGGDPGRSRFMHA